MKEVKKKRGRPSLSPGGGGSVVDDIHEEKGKQKDNDSKSIKQGKKERGEYLIFQQTKLFRKKKKDFPLREEGEKGVERNPDEER